MKKRLLLLLAALVCFAAEAPAAAACGNNNNQIVGAVVGGVLGGLLGAKIDGGRKNTFGTLVGAGLGALAGSAIAKALDKCEQEKMSKATESALNAPPPPQGGGYGNGTQAPAQTWKSDTRPGVGGSVSVGAPMQTSDGRVCRSARRVNYVDGQEMSDAPTYCRTPPSSAWTVKA